MTSLLFHLSRFCHLIPATVSLPVDGCIIMTILLQFLYIFFFFSFFVQVYGQKVEFAPIGLINMYNSGGATNAIEVITESSDFSIRIKGRGPGIFGAYSNLKPMSCSVNMKDEAFEFRNEDCLLTIPVPSNMDMWEIAVYY